MSGSIADDDKLGEISVPVHKNGWLYLSGLGIGESKWLFAASSLKKQKRENIGIGDHRHWVIEGEQSVFVRTKRYSLSDFVGGK